MGIDIAAALEGMKVPTVRASILRGSSDKECWPWQGFITDKGYGYGYFPESLRRVSAHRLVWMLLVGPLTPDQVLDHICHDPDLCHEAEKCPHRACVNPSHLKVTTLALNSMRGDSPVARNAQKTHCKNGHAFDEGNTIYRAGGGRTCKACAVIRYRAKTIERGGKPRLRRRTVDLDSLGR